MIPHHRMLAGAHCKVAVENSSTARHTMQRCERAGRMIHLNELIVQCRKQSQSIEASPFKTTSFSQFSPPHQCAVAQRSKTFTFGSCEMRRTSAKVKRKERNTLPRFKKTGFCFGVPIYCLLFKNTHAHNRGRTQNSFAFLPK